MARLNSRKMLAEHSNNQNRLLYELASVCAQIAQVDQFELLVKNAINEDESSNLLINKNSTVTNKNLTINLDGSWLSVIKV